MTAALVDRIDIAQEVCIRDRAELSPFNRGWSAFRLLERSSARAWRFGRAGLAGVCIAVAALWTGERFLALVASL